MRQEVRPRESFQHRNAAMIAAITIAIPVKEEITAW